MTPDVARPECADIVESAWSVFAKIFAADPAGAALPTAFVPLPPIGHLVGREHEVEALVRRVVEQRMLTITGPPGVGKSRLAVEVAARV
jgi:MoxR-like ATPase